MKLRRRVIFMTALIGVLGLGFIESVSALAPDIDFGYKTIPGMWIVPGGYNSTEVIENPVDKNDSCISLASTSDSATEARIEYEFTESNTGYYLEGKFSVEMSLYFPKLMNSRIQLYGHMLPDKTNAESFNLRFCSDGCMWAGDRELSSVYEAGKWYKVKFIVDTDAQTVKVLFGSGDNYEVVTVKDSASQMSFKMHNNPGDCYRIRYAIDKNQNGMKTYLDDISLRSESGLADTADVKSFTLISDGNETDVLSETVEDISIKADIRINPVKTCMLIAALYDDENVLCGVGADYVTQTGVSEVSLGNVDTTGKYLRCFVWEAGIIAPVDNIIFAGKMVVASDYGVIPNTGSDMTENLQNVIGMLSDGATLVLDEGKYIVSPEIGEKYCLSLANLKNVTIDGRGASFLLSDSFSGFASIKGGSGITLKNITVDYENKPWEQGTVTNLVRAANENEKSYFDMKVIDNSGFFDTERFKNNVASCFLTVRDNDDPTLQNKKSNEHYLVSGVTSLGNDTYRFYISDWSEGMIFGGGMELGDKVIINLRNMSGSAFVVSGASDVEINNVRVLASGECGIKAIYMNGDLSIDGFQMRIADGRWICSNADGVHFQFSRGKLRMRNCVFEGLGDDCVNLYQIPLTVSAAADSTLTLSGSVQMPVVGDSLTVMDSISGLIRRRGVKVTAVSSNTITLDEDCADIVAGDIVFIENGMFYGSEIINNKFINSRRYGLIIRAENIRVEGNEFTNLGSDAVAAHCGSGEGMALTDAYFKDNIITNCGYLRNGQQSSCGAFSIKNILAGDDDVNIHTNLVFSGNIIRNASACGFYINSADGVTIYATNVIEGLADGKYGINISECKNVTVEDGIKMSYITSDESVKMVINGVEN